MRIVMPLFDFVYEDSQEFVFGDGRYALRRFVADDEIPQIDGLSKLDIQYMKMEYWALVAEDPDVDRYKQEVNILLLSFKIYKLARPFMKYHLCKEDTRLCLRINETMQYILPEKSTRQISFSDLVIINNGFSNLLKMDAVSNRTHNALYFLYRGFFSKKWMDAFVFLMIAIESLFSKEEPGEATKTICSRVSKFLDSKPRCEYKNIQNLYNIRSQIVHGKIEANDKPRDDLTQLHDLEYVVTECMKKILDENLYLIYGNVQEKESYYNRL